MLRLTFYELYLTEEKKRSKKLSSFIMLKIKNYCTLKFFLNSLTIENLSVELF